MNFWNHGPDNYQPQSWNGRYLSPDYYGNHSKNFYHGAPGQLWMPPSQNSHVYPVTSMSVITRSTKPSSSGRAPSNTPPQPRRPRSKSSNTPSTMEIPSAPTALSTPTLPPIVHMAVSSSQNTVSPVRFHTPNASLPNNPDKDDGDESDNISFAFPGFVAAPSSSRSVRTTSDMMIFAKMD